VISPESATNEEGAIGAETASKRLERLREPGFQKFAQFDCCPKLWNRIQLLECRRERVGQTPDRSRPEFLVLRFEVEVMHAAGEVLGSFQSAFDKGLVDHHLGGDVSQFAHLPGLHLLSHRLEVPLHSVNADGDAVDERERL
jgi:hypothetical protein